MRDAASDSIFRTESSLPDSLLECAVACALRHGFSVALKPHINLLDGSPRLTVEPRDIAGWSWSYRAFLDPCLTLSVKYDVPMLVVGTELGKAADAPEFHAIVDDVRGRYGGKLVYAVCRKPWFRYVSLRHVLC
jgi:hypothetical protein